MFSRQLIVPLCLPALLLGSLGCPDEGLGEALPRLRVAQEVLDFGPVRVGEDAALSVAFSNDGTAPLVVEGLAVTGDSNAGWFDLSSVRLEIGPGRTESLTVTFGPVDVGEAEAALRFTSTDADAPAGEIVLRGSGYLPLVTVDPDELAFGTLVVDSARALDLVLENHHTEAVYARIREPTGSGASHFEVPPPESGLGGAWFITAGTTLRVPITYAPSASGGHLASLVVEPCSGCSSTSVSLSGEAIDSGLLVTPGLLNFGMARPGASLADSVTFENIGNVPVSITGLTLVDPEDEGEASPAFRLEHGALPLEVPPAEIAEVTLVFTPDALGLHEARLDWTSTDRERTRGYVPVRGRGGAPWIDVVPMALHFERAAVGLPTHRTLTVANVGEEDLEIHSMTVLDGAPFRILEPASGPIPPGEAREVTVAFEPVAEATATGSLRIASNDPHDPEIYVSLQGDGLDLPPCELSIDPDAVAFGVVDRGATRARPVRLDNVGPRGARCLIDSMALADDDGGAFELLDGGAPAEGLLLDGGEHHVLKIGFTPGEHGAYEGVLALRVSDPDDPWRTVPVSGASLETHLLVVPDRLDFGTLPVDCGARTQSICLHNTAPTAYTLRDVVLSGAPAGVFSLQNLPPGLGEPGVPLPSGSSLCFGVGFEAPAATSYLAEVAIVLDEIAHPFLVPLAGRGSLDAMQTERFVQPAEPEVDILFVVGEYSTGLLGIQYPLRDNGWAFFQVADQLEVDYHIGVLSSDAREANGGGILRPLDRSRPHIVMPTLPDPPAVFQQNVVVGTDPVSTVSRYFRAVEKALHPASLEDPQRNAGFLRPEAHLSLIFLSLFPEYSGDDCGVLVGAPGCGTVDYYLGVFSRAKGFREDKLSVHAVVGHTNPSCGYNFPHTRFIEMAERTGGHVSSVCTDDWAGDLTELAPRAFGYTSRFVLMHEPDPDTLEVTIVQPDGQGTPGALWSYDADANAIVFEPLGIPAPGETVEVSYLPVCSL